MGNASLKRAQQQLMPTTVAPKYIATEPEVRRSCVIVLRQHTKRQLADATDTTIEAARHWIEGQRTPNLASIINLARSLPQVRAWLYEQIEGGNRAAQSGSDEAVTEALARLAKSGGLEQIMRDALGLHDKRERRDALDSATPRKELASKIDTAFEVAKRNF